MIDYSNTEALLREAWVKRREEKYDEAQSLVAEAHSVCKEDDYHTLGRIFHVYMQLESDWDRPSKALEFCLQSVAYYQKAGDKNKIAHSTRHLADIQRRLGMEADSERNYRAAINLYRDNPKVGKGDLANALRGFALLLEQAGKVPEAIAVWTETKALYRACKLQAGVDEADRKLDSLM